MPRGGAVAAALVALLAAGCSGAVDVDSPDLDAEVAATCEAFLADVPEVLADLERRDVEPGDAPALAWGDPAITLTCGTATPSGFNRASQCEVAEDVGWYVPPEQYDDQTLELTLTAVEFEPRVELVVPGEYRPNGVAAALAQLGAPVKEHLERVNRCR